MKALDRYIKKTGKEPYGKTKPKGKWEGSKGPQKKDQYAEATGKKVVDDTKDFDETDPETSGIGAYEAVRGYGPKKNKQRSYLSDD